MSQPRDDLAPNEEPLFNIGAVSRMTDIAETTLRVWERRYEFPNAARTAGGHRLYSQQEVQRLQWVKQRVDEGMQISQAIRALIRAEQDDNPLHGPFASPLLQRREGDHDPLVMFQQRLIDALLQHDADLADQVLAEALAVFPLEFLILDVIGPTFHELGEGWSAGRIDVATEHFATNHLRHQLLVWMRTVPPAYQVNPVVMACAPGELHEGSLLMLAVLLRRLRWPVIYLGQTMPLSEIASFVNEMDAAVLVFVAMTEAPARALLDWPHWLPEASRAKRPVVGFGGRIFVEQPELAGQIPGVYLGMTLQEGLETLDRMLHEMNPLLH
ncbi:MAG: MerR family transcriptional regulator [Anaerolineae bacterium]|nr:MerR family transcriptional regulator [Anaerolineae bacterium]